MNMEINLTGHRPQTRQSLIDDIVKAVNNMPSEDSLALFNWWAPTGGGKTSMLHALHERLVTVPSVLVLGPWDEKLSTKEKIVEEIRLAVEHADPNLIKIVLIDNLEAVLADYNDDPAFAGFEHECILELMLRNDVLVVVTSRYELRQWREMEVRMRQASINIPALTRKEFDQAALKAGLDPQYAYRLTFGHPMVLSWLRENPELDEAALKPRIVQYFLGRLKPQARLAARAASLLFRFNVTALQRALAAAGLESSLSYMDLLQLIREMAFNGLLVNDIKAGAYRFADSAVRRLLARGFQAEYPQPFAEIHRNAANYYQEEARRPSFLHNNLVNAIYHLVYSSLPGGKAQTTQACIQWLKNTAPIWLDANWKAVSDAWESGSGDPAVVEEFQQLLDAANYSRISKEIRQASKKAEVTQ